MGKVVGIDLGTVNSVIAVMEGGTAQVIPNQEGARTTPSVVAFTRRGERLVGQIAKRQAPTNPENTVHAVKRLIGRRYGWPEIQAAKRVLPYRIVPSANGEAHVKIDHRVYSPPEISALVLMKLKAAAEDYLGEPVEDAIITAPAYFSDSQRQATKDAGAIAGLRVLRILNESTAAALAYGAQHTQAATVAVYDLGGGSFNISILELTDGLYQVLATGGDTYLGGEDIDQLIINWLVDEFKEETEIDLAGGSMALVRLKEAAENAKCELSTSTQSEIVLPFISANQSGPKHLNTVLTRATFEEMIHPLLERTVEPCMQALKDAGLTKDEIDDVVMVGGQTRTPKVVEIVRKVFGREPNRSVNPDEVVSMGAAIQTGILSGEVTDLVLLDVTPHTLGIETEDGTFTPLIDRQATVPTKKGRIFTTVTDNQTKVEVHVLQGENEQAAYNTSLGRFQLTDIPPAAKGEPQIEVSFEIDVNGIVQVTALDQATGRQQNIVTRAGSGLSEAEVGRLRIELLTRDRDELTGLYNRRSLERHLSSGWEAAATGNMPLSLVLVDLDGFKAVNDEHGHEIGDGVLQSVAYLLEEHVEGKGRAYRFGGEEFLLILEGHTAREAAVVADQFREKLQATKLTKARIKLTVSAGVASFPKDAREMERLMECADKALFIAKKMGRNRVCVFGESEGHDPDSVNVREPRPGRSPQLPPKSRKPTI